MGIFDSNFNRNVKFDFDGKNLPFVSLADYAAANGTDAVVPVKGMFTHNKSKYGEKGVVVTEKCNIDVPTHMVKDIKKVRESADMVAAVNAGNCGMKIYTYTDNNGVLRYSGTFTDI